MITFAEVTKQFGDGTIALDAVSFHIDAGELVVVTGPSGSGKTTLMRLLIRDYEPTAGSIFYKNEPLESLSAGQIPYHRRKIGVVFQDYRLLPELNVWENIALPLSIIGKPQEEIESRVTDLLNLVGLADRALVFPKQLSGGEAQRVSIARALATGPSLIFADEPTGNLDKKASLGIVKLLQQINSLGTTVLLATHDVTLLDYLKGERQLELEKGSLAHDSKPKSIPQAPATVAPLSANDTKEHAILDSQDDDDQSDQSEEPAEETLAADQPAEEKTAKSDDLAAAFSTPKELVDKASKVGKGINLPKPGKILSKLKLPTLSLSEFGKKILPAKSAKKSDTSTKAKEKAKKSKKQDKKDE